MDFPHIRTFNPVKAAGIALIALAVAAGATVAFHAQAAVSQVTTLYACMMPSGGPARVWSFAPTCDGGQVVHWSVSGTAPATTTTTKPPTTVPPTNGEVRMPGTYLTAYDFADNNPPNSGAISHPVIHQTAGGTGTFADPLTVAVDHLASGADQFAPGTKFYVPNVRAYLIAEDTTGETAPATTHLDMWADGRTSSVSSAFNCMSHVTGHYLVIRNPASSYAVVTGSLSANNTCRDLFGDTVVSAGGTPPPVVTTTTASSGGTGGACPTADQPSTYPGPTLTDTQLMQAAYNAGFHTVAQLQAVVGIAGAESSKKNATRNWHPDYGCRPASDVIGVQGPDSVWNVGHTRQLNSDRGVWQISSHFWPQFSDAICDNVTTAAQAMWTIYSTSSNGFGQWDTYPSPALSQAPSVAAVNAFLATQ